jgi:hypothetical protein
MIWAPPGRGTRLDLSAARQRKIEASAASIRPSADYQPLQIFEVSFFEFSNFDLTRAVPMRI